MRPFPLPAHFTERNDCKVTTAEKARAAKNEYMRRYRQTPEGREKIAEAQRRYWARKFDAAQETEAPTNSTRRTKNNAKV